MQVVFTRVEARLGGSMALSGGEEINVDPVRVLLGPCGEGGREDGGIPKEEENCGRVRFAGSFEIGSAHIRGDI